MATERRSRSRVDRLQFLVAFVLVFAGVAGGLAFAEYGQPDRAVTRAALPAIPAGLVRGQVIHPCDIVDITVDGEPTLTNRYAVGEDGAVKLPAVGAVSLDGLTPAAAAGRIAALLADGFVDPPDVSLTIVHSDYHSVFVIGAVRLPGVIAVSGPLFLTMVLALAGSPTGRASRTIVVARPGDPETLTPTHVGDPHSRTIEMDVDRDAWAALGDGDTVYVPLASPFDFVGEISDR
jgi:polysaccharide export outer membrane protein